MPRRMARMLTGFTDSARRVPWTPCKNAATTAESNSDADATLRGLFVEGSVLVQRDRRDDRQTFLLLPPQSMNGFNVRIAIIGNG